MGKEDQAGSTEEIFAAAIPNVAAMRGAINQSLASSDVNAIAVGNQAIIAKKKRKILYKNGYTLPRAAEELMAEAQSDIDHSRKLGRNLRRADPTLVRPQETDTHHVVAAEAAAARPARVLIFAVGIGINDADNGVILPRFKRTRIASMPNASPHQHIHTQTYHANVVAELYGADDIADGQEVRGILRSISGRLVRGQFRF